MARPQSSNSSESLLVTVPPELDPADGASLLLRSLMITVGLAGDAAAKIDSAAAGTKAGTVTAIAVTGDNKLPA